MSRGWRIALLGALCVLQCGVVAQMIIGQESLLAQGQAFRFKTAPVDPVDPFRGRYVTLQLEDDTAPAPQGDWQPQWKTYAYVQVEAGPDGFAQLTQVTERPPEGSNYLKLKVYTVRNGRVEFDAQETVAPEIERAYMRNSRREKQRAWIQLRVRNGKGAIEELFFDDLPVADYLRREASRTP